ncbi:MAG: N-acetylmuramoyl-L-alanine amidase [Oceanospirillaceae bacterium]|jgi:N-acetylmuramoyl-L-alanine amidase
MMKAVVKLVLQISIIFVAVLPHTYLQAQERINNVRIWLAPESTRLVFDLSGPVKHKIFSLKNPSRVVLDIQNVALNVDLNKLKLSDSPIKKLRAGKGLPLRIVLDLSEDLKPISFALVPNKEYGHRLVVDLARTGKALAEKTKKIEIVAKPVLANVVDKKNVTKAKPLAGKKLRDIVIALDAGHGGEDPGAIGASGLREKTVVLAIAKELEKLIDKENGFISRMIRRNDYYVSLRGRTAIARKKNADLFVSIHADAFKNKNARGASVWVLSNKGASSEVGRWLAQKENSSDLIGGVGNLSLGNKDAVLKGVLLDMSMTASRKDSREIAEKIHKNIDKFAKMHKPSVERAGFLVLKSPDIPSMLIETGFISNPKEEAALKTVAYRRKMANAIFTGIKEHFLKKPPAFTEIYRLKYGNDLVKKQEYKVVSGDSLSRIASQYGVKIASLREINKIKNDKIRIGQRLQIPAS